MVVLDNVVKYFTLSRTSLFHAPDAVHSVDGVSLRIEAGGVLGLVGESGSGKSTLARVILTLLRSTSGTVTIDGVDVTNLSQGAMRRVRRTAQMVFQDPHAAMDPRMTIGESMTSVLTQHGVGTRAERRDRVSLALSEVGLDDSYIDRYPGECSGGQLQRVGIARALLLDPKVLICDEPTSALDASVQARVLNLLDRIKDERELTMIMISHDLRVVRHVADRVAVMYLGQIVEVADREKLFTGASHPYTIALLAAGLESGRRHEATVVAAGEPPSPIHPPAGCRFNTRCPLATDRCREEMPELREVGADHEVRCHRWEEARGLLCADETAP
ncbi:ABC transporter ATP-binding protein [Occultella glacieicola]|uniref:ABC transporter ATP-binding protein n=2 Tax=Occultella glacieicola TaxID=2518684 RepID=A0ABY2DXJ5_9MICO|nr:ABC transporter ATP-binding protein [Occultella glacieicola]